MVFLCDLWDNDMYKDYKIIEGKRAKNLELHGRHFYDIL